MQALRAYLSSASSSAGTAKSKKLTPSKEDDHMHPKLPNPYKLSPKPSRPKPFISFLVENKSTVVEVQKPNIWIGSGKSNCWRLTETVQCQRIEDQHARLFYNPHENVWEILNYSSSGIYVNGTLFGFKSTDFTPASATTTSERLQELQEMTNKRLDEFIKHSGDELQAADAAVCFCKPFPIKPSVNIFEGSAKLYANTKIEIGCAKLIVQQVGPMVN
ncbi:PHD finger protein 12 [Orchesella cincta]|uniref:PHD finger protein 12 n=1 Tax=Orchesella cincta TaxID=48709 RepID=A0A1D2NI34_ORCCI|nr:PHD finger protein 12 [Orchesella cincta]